MIDSTTEKTKTTGTFQVGAHVSIAGGHAKALQRAIETGCEVVQVFTKNNMQWFARPLEQKEVDAYHRAREVTNLKRIFAHSGYLINLAGHQPENLEKSRKSLLDELERCSQLELPFIVLHPGSHLGKGEAEGLQRILDSLDWIFERYDGATQIALEVTCGAGNTLGGRIEHLAHLIDNSRHADRLTVCLDTCHLFAAGYDVRNSNDIEAFIAEFKRHLPWEKIVCVHINDSKGDLGSRLDRHEILGKGKIGWACFNTLVHHPAFASLPLCLETPKGKDNINDIETLNRLKEARQAPA